MMAICLGVGFAAAIVAEGGDGGGAVVLSRGSGGDAELLRLTLLYISFSVSIPNMPSRQHLSSRKIRPTKGRYRVDSYDAKRGVHPHVLSGAY